MIESPYEYETVRVVFLMHGVNWEWQSSKRVAIGEIGWRKERER